MTFMKVVSNKRVFVDTNILFYASNPVDEFGLLAVNKLNELIDANNELLISGQVIREYAVVTFRNALYHKLSMKDTIEKVLANITTFRNNFTTLHESENSLDNWVGLVPKLTTSKDVFDFNIAALLKDEGIGYVFTHNVRDFEKFNDWLTIVPLID